MDKVFTVKVDNKDQLHIVLLRELLKYYLDNGIRFYNESRVVYEIFNLKVGDNRFIDISVNTVHLHRAIDGLMLEVRIVNNCEATITEHKEVKLYAVRIFFERNNTTHEECSTVRASSSARAINMLLTEYEERHVDILSVKIVK